MNVFDLAMEKELEVKAHYEKLAGEAGLACVKRIFSLLAEDEQKHYDMIMTMKHGAGQKELADSTALEAARELIDKLMGDEDAASRLNSSLDSYRHALKVEAESVRFYQEIAAKEKDAGLRKVLMKILGEEKKHYNIIENLYDFTLKPGYFLAWAEFSNLRDL